MTTHNNILTNGSDVSTDTDDTADEAWLRAAQHRLAEATLSVATSSPDGGVASSAPVVAATVPSLLVRARLSPATRLAEERRLEKIQRKKEVLRNPKKRDRRRKPWTAKQATLRRRKAKEWAEDPFGCVLHTYGAKRIERALWDKYIQPLWRMYDPAHLTVVWKKPYGSKAHPRTVYNCIVYYRGEPVYDGFSQELYDLSGGLSSSTDAAS